MRKELDLKVWKLERQLEETKSAFDRIRDEIKEKFEGCDICEWSEDYDCEEDNISEYWFVGNIDEILDIIDKYKKARGEE